MKNVMGVCTLALFGLWFGSFIGGQINTIADEPNSSPNAVIWEKLDELDSRLLQVEQDLTTRLTACPTGRDSSTASPTGRDSLTARATPRDETAQPSPSVEAPQSTVSPPPATTSTNYRARWTHPDTIERHMAEFHGVDVAGKSKSQLLQEHDAIHDVIGPVSHTSSASVQSTVVRSYQSNCPGGVCPVPQSRSTSTTVPRLRIFRR